jgi:hypothetical protein
MMDPAFGVVLVSGDNGWSRAVHDALRRRSVERLVFARPDTLSDALDGKAALFVDGRLSGDAAALVARCVRDAASSLRVVLVEAEASEPDASIARLAHWRDTRLPDSDELATLIRRTAS